MNGIHLSLPILEAEVRKLQTGDVVYLTGTVYQLTGAAHKRALAEGLPFSTEGAAVYHAYTSFAREEIGGRLNYLGATTSATVNVFEPEFIRRFKVRTIIGKGGMDTLTLEAMREVGCVYLAQVGGCSALYSAGVEKISATYWDDLGPNLMLKLAVKDFGPLTVAMDALGNSIFARVEEVLRGNVSKVYARIGIGVE